MKERIYVDTSVIGGCLDDEYRIWSRRLLNGFIGRTAVMVVSDLTLLELKSAPAAVREVLDAVRAEFREDILMDEEAASLAEDYLVAGVLSRKQWFDAQHIALATKSRVDVLVSWNFKHIVNLQRIHGYNSVNLRRGYPQLEIRTPREVVGDEES